MSALERSGTLEPGDEDPTLWVGKQDSGGRVCAEAAGREADVGCPPQPAFSSHWKSIHTGSCGLQTTLTLAPAGTLMRPIFLVGQPGKLSLLLVIANPFPVGGADFEQRPLCEWLWGREMGEHRISNMRNGDPDHFLFLPGEREIKTTSSETSKWSQASPAWTCGPPGQRDSRRAIKGSRAGCEHASLLWPYPARPGIAGHGISTFSHSCRKSSLCRRKLVSLPLGGERKWPYPSFPNPLPPPLPPPFSTVHVLPSLPSVSSSRRHRYRGQRQRQRAGPRAPAGAGPGLPLSSCPPRLRGHWPPAPCLRFLHTLCTLSAAWPVPPWPLLSLAKPHLFPQVQGICHLLREVLSDLVPLPHPPSLTLSMGQRGAVSNPPSAQQGPH
ncbi:uncharacterized protein LOC125168577 [Prionailurus viverrinus]|uniref:uncharacterized protein LOC125168577 n=1 Tax=Prionailurus viverrinus TaxID=61388 RepID=UPI001FF13523|nr:uncharacterized protein LOC125168577 [Prionailurus viverrinus]